MSAATEPFTVSLAELAALSSGSPGLLFGGDSPGLSSSTAPHEPQQQQHPPSALSSMLDGELTEEQWASAVQEAAVLPMFQTAAEVESLAATRWLTNEEVWDVLTNGLFTYGVELQKAAPHQPAPGTLLFFSKQTCKNFRNDGHTWRTKKNGKSLAEAHEKLKVRGTHRVVAYYSTAADGQLARRVYSLLEDKDLVLVHYFASTPQAILEPLAIQQPPAQPMAKGSSPPQQQPVPAAFGAAAQQPMDCGPGTLQAEPRPIAAPAFAHPPQPPLSSSASPFFSPVSAVPTQPTAASLDGGPTAPTTLHDARNTIQELEARIRQLELEKMRSPPTAGATTAVAPPSATAPPPVAVAAAAAAAAASQASEPPPQSAESLTLLDFTPEWDETSGGSKMLLTAETRAGCSYTATFGEAMVAVSLVRPNVLRLYVPPCATGERGGDVALRLLCLSPEGQLLQQSAPARFTYRARHTPRDSASSSPMTPLMTASMPHRLPTPQPATASQLEGMMIEAPCCSSTVASVSSSNGLASPLGSTGRATPAPTGQAEAPEPMATAADGAGGGGGGGGRGGGGGDGGGDGIFDMALSLSSGPEVALDQHFTELIGALGDDDVTQLRRLQRAVRHRLRRQGAAALGGGASVAAAQQSIIEDEDETGDLEASSRLVQRTFRSRRRQRIDNDSRRRAALAIERFYLKRNRANTSTSSALWRLQRDVEGGCGSPRGSSSSSPSLGPTAGMAGLGEIDEEDGGDLSQLGLIVRAQAAFRARKARKQAVRRIEQAYQEWKYHAEQANLAAQGVRNSASGTDEADTSLKLHSYHARCRERAARTIQGYLLRQQPSEAARAASDAAGGEPGPFSEAQLQLLRRAQRAFRSHLQQQAADAQELAEQTRRDATSMMGDHQRVCEVLRRAAAGGALQGDESQLLTQLQLAFRANLEKKHRAATTILRAAERRRLGAVAEQ